MPLPQKRGTDMQVIIDRFEGDFAVVEAPNTQFYNLPRALCPDAKEGDVLIIEVDSQTTLARAERISKLMDSVFEE